jgi:citrate lyase beta subunit
MDVHEYQAKELACGPNSNAIACRPYGLRPIDGPFGDFADADGYLSAAKRAAVLGYESKWAIHPSQIELANQIFTPSEAEVTKARRILEAMAQAAKEGKGAVAPEGRLIDVASIRMAEALLTKANAIAGPVDMPGRSFFWHAKVSRFRPERDLRRTVFLYFSEFGDTRFSLASRGRSCFAMG